MLTRRSVLWGAALPLAARTRPPDVLDLARRHVKIAEANGEQRMLWGRLGGSREERASAALVARQLGPFVDRATLEPLTVPVYRAVSWTLELNAAVLPSAVPLPADSRFVAPDPAPVVPWSERGGARGKWLFVANPPERNLVREENLYRQAVEAGAAGLVFAHSSGDGGWRCVPPLDRAFALRDAAYPELRRPIPCFSAGAADGDRIARGGTLKASIRYDPFFRRNADNAAGYLAGGIPKTVLFSAHLDSYFSGACDNATSLAALVALAARLKEAPKAKRASFWFLAQAAHHDGGLGMRAFLDADPARAAAISEVLMLEHLDAKGNNDRRAAYYGPQGWPEAEAATPRLCRETSLCLAEPAPARAMISDLFVLGERLADPPQWKTFCLIQSPPFYHTDHDTLENISREGVERAVEFHVRLLRETGALGG
jgi:hypothetical protein